MAGWAERQQSDLSNRQLVLIGAGVVGAVTLLTTLEAKTGTSAYEAAPVKAKKKAAKTR